MGITADEFAAVIIEELVDLGCLEEVYQHYLDDLPNECVGLIWSDGKVQRLINQARSPKRFSVSLVQLAEALVKEGIILAIYHSHPGGSTGLSPDDQASIKGQYRDGIPIPWLVVTEDTATLWYMDETATHIRSLKGRGKHVKSGLVRV